MPVGDPRRRTAAQSRTRQRGFTYVALLVAMFLLALATQGVMTFVSQQAQREREADLLRIGQTYAKAIGSYHESTPGSLKRWPRKLGDLVDDRRFVTIRRHLRDLYPDPMTRLNDWELVQSADGGIMGVRSRSQAVPIRTAAPDLAELGLGTANRYSEWQFIYQPGMAGAAPRLP